MSLSDRCRYPAGWHTLRGHRGISPAAKGVAWVVERTRSVHGIPLGGRRQGWPARWRSQSPGDQAEPARLEWAARFCDSQMPLNARLAITTLKTTGGNSSRKSSGMGAGLDPWALAEDHQIATAVPYQVDRSQALLFGQSALDLPSGQRVLKEMALVFLGVRGRCAAMYDEKY